MLRGSPGQHHAEQQGTARLSLYLLWKASPLGLGIENSHSPKSWQIRELSVQKIRLVFYNQQEGSC